MRPAIEKVFPRPREVAVAGTAGSAAEIEAAPDRSLPAQGYELLIGPGGTRVRYADELGLRYARQTLSQLARATDGQLPQGRIGDWPDFEHRGFMLDVSRDRVPTMSTLEWLVARLADLRYNHLQLYTEHTFAYSGHEAVWRDASPITPAELRHLDQLCRENGIELSTCQSTFGHMDRWLSHSEYRHRAECPDGSERPLWPGRLPPWTLEPTPDNAEFALDLVREQAANLRSRRVNICADEPFDLGRGRSRARVEEHGLAQVFVEHLRRLTDPLIEEGYEVLFWGDGLNRHPELVPSLPEKGASAVVWRYEAPDPDAPSLDTLLSPELVEMLGIPDGANLGFVSYARPYTTAGYPFWVAPGTSSWNSLAGRWTNARGNLLDAATTGLATGASGFLVTDWGDNGHLQPLPVSLPPMSYGAGVAWCRTSNHDADVTAVVDRLLEADRGVGARLLELGDLYRRLGLSASNGSPILYGLLGSGMVLGKPDPEAAEAAEAVIREAEEHVAAKPFYGPRADAFTAELVVVCRLLRHGLQRLRQDHRMGDVDGELLLRELAETEDLYRQAWLATSRPGGLEDSAARLRSGTRPGREGGQGPP